MGCLKIKYDPVGKTLAKKWKIFERGLEKNASAEKNRINYYPFGMQMPGRSFSSENYRYGFAGYEKDDEVKGSGNHYSFSDYGYDPRINRRWNLDPKYNEIPGVSPYSYAFNNPILFKDPDGELPIIPFLLKASASAGADALLQASMIFLTDDDVETFGQALTKVDKTDVALSFLEGLNPFRVPGGKLGEAALVGFADALIGIGEAAIDGEEVTGEQIGHDFLIGTLSQLAGDQVSDILGSKTARKKLLNLLGDKGGDVSPNVQKVLDMIEDIKTDGGSVTPPNKLNSNQELNLTIKDGNGGKIDMRVESHPLPAKYGGDGKSSTRHMNVDLSKNGKKQRGALPKSGHKNLEEK